MNRIHLLLVIISAVPIGFVQAANISDTPSVSDELLAKLDKAYGNPIFMTHIDVYEEVIKTPTPVLKLTLLKLTSFGLHIANALGKKIFIRNELIKRDVKDSINFALNELTGFEQKHFIQEAYTYIAEHNPELTYQRIIEDKLYVGDASEKVFEYFAKILSTEKLMIKWLQLKQSNSVNRRNASIAIRSLVDGIDDKDKLVGLYYLFSSGDLTSKSEKQSFLRHWLLKDFHHFKQQSELGNIDVPIDFYETFNYLPFDKLAADEVINRANWLLSKIKKDDKPKVVKSLAFSMARTMPICDNVGVIISWLETIEGIDLAKQTKSLLYSYKFNPERLLPHLHLITDEKIRTFYVNRIYTNYRRYDEELAAQFWAESPYKHLIEK